MPKLSFRWPGWIGKEWAAFAAAPGKVLWPIVLAVGVLAAGYLAATSLFNGGPPEPAPSDPTAMGSSAVPSMPFAPLDYDWLAQSLRVIALVVLALAMLAALVRLLKWLSAQGLAPRLATTLKLALALAPVSIWPLASVEGVYRPMQEPLRSYLLLIACPFIAASVLVAFDRRRAWWLAVIAALALAGLFLGAGAIGRGLLEPIEHLRAALLVLSPDQRMWWLTLAAFSVAVFALVSAIGDKPSSAGSPKTKSSNALGL